MSRAAEEITVNGRSYRLPQVPTVVICLDGSEPAYTETAMAAGAMPYLTATLARGFNRTARSVIPSFTNPNNLSIVTGVTPAQHGISGNYFIDPDDGTAVMMNDPKYLRAESVLAACSRRGVGVGVVTAKDKLRRLLAHGLEAGVCFSAEKADAVTQQEHGVGDVVSVMGEGAPDVYSARLTTYALWAGVKLLAGDFPGICPPKLLYLSTSDYLQHKCPPGSREAEAFYGEIDRILAAIDNLGGVWVLTADHGMQAKAKQDGSPNVVYLQELLDEAFGVAALRVILPITDPYVVHHGALGSFATIYTTGEVSVSEVIARVRAQPGISWIGSRAEACDVFSLPPDRLGEIVVISDGATALGTSVQQHDLSCLEVPLRSHGGLSEQQVPLYANRPIQESLATQGHQWRNFDAFHLALNLLQ